jgi:hypothetical protein
MLGIARAIRWSIRRATHPSSTHQRRVDRVDGRRCRRRRRNPGTSAAESTIYALGMCRNIRPLHNFDPRATDEEARDAALQYVRKISGSTKPSQANQEAFDRAVDAITAATVRLLDELVTSAPPKNREREAEKARARAAQRYAA